MRRKVVVAKVVRPCPDRALVFAYGSNLDAKQMRDRCPSARLVGESRLFGYGLAFCGHSVGWGGAVATITPGEGRVTHGVIWDISREDLARLDTFEGCPSTYRRTSTRATVRGQRRRIHVYEHTRPERAALPGPRYVGQIIRAYKKHGFDIDLVGRALDETYAAATASVW